MPERTLAEVRVAAARRLLFLPHAMRQMARPERMITTEEVERVVSEGELIEDYPEDIRSHSCLLLGFVEGGRPIHVVCVPKENYLGVVTAYIYPIHCSGLQILREGFNMECIYCKGRLERASAPFSVERKGYHIHWSNIPAWVCTQCGEPYFESQEVNTIQKALSILDAETASLLG